MHFFVGIVFASTLQMCLVVVKKCSQAFGVLSVGSGAGGTVLPIITQKPFWKVIITLAVIVANLFLCPRLPPSNVKGGLFDWHAIENPAFACCVLAYNVSLLGLYVPLIYPLSGQEAGYSPNFTFYLISVANCASLIGRLSSGIIADKFGALNTLNLFTLVAFGATGGPPLADVIRTMSDGFVLRRSYGMLAVTILLVATGSPSSC